MVIQKPGNRAGHLLKEPGCWRGGQPSQLSYFAVSSLNLVRKEQNFNLLLRKKVEIGSYKVILLVKSGKKATWWRREEEAVRWKKKWEE